MSVHLQDQQLRQDTFLQDGVLKKKCILTLEIQKPQYQSQQQRRNSFKSQVMKNIDIKVNIPCSSRRSTIVSKYLLRSGHSNLLIFYLFFTFSNGSLLQYFSSAFECVKRDGMSNLKFMMMTTTTMMIALKRFIYLEHKKMLAKETKSD